MSTKSPLTGDRTNEIKQASFGSVFAAYNLQHEANFLANDRPKSNISFNQSTLDTNTMANAANSASELKPTFNSTPIMGLIDLAMNRNSSKSDKTTCWGKDGLQPINHLVGYTQLSLRIKDAALTKVFSGDMDISKTAYPDTSNSSIREVEILYLQTHVTKLKEARYNQLLSEHSNSTFENLENWTDSGLLVKVPREQFASLSDTQKALLGGATQRAENINAWTCATNDFNFRQPLQIYDAPLTSVTLNEKLDYVSRRGIDKLIIAHAKLPFSSHLAAIVDAEFAPHKLTNRSTDADVLLTKSFYNLSFDAQKESTALISKQQDTLKQVKQMRIDAEAILRNSIKPSLLDEDDLDRIHRFDFKDFLTILLTKQLGQHEIKKNLLEPIVDSFTYEEVRSTTMDLKTFFKSLTHLIGIDILTRIYKATKFLDPTTRFNDFHELLTSIPMSDGEYRRAFNCQASNRSILRTHTEADFKDIFINSVKDSALHDKALELEKKRDTLSLDEIRLAFREAMKDLKDKTADKNEISVLYTEREVRNLSSRLLTLEGGHHARSMEVTPQVPPSDSGGGRSNGGGQQPPRGHRDNRTSYNEAKRGRSQSSDRSQRNWNPPSRDSSRDRTPRDNNRERGYPSEQDSDAGRSYQSQNSRGTRASSGRDSYNPRRQQLGGGRSAPARFPDRGNDRGRSRSRERGNNDQGRQQQDQNRGRSPARDNRGQHQDDRRQARGNSPFPYAARQPTVDPRNPNAQPRGYRPTRGRDYAQASPRRSFHTMNEERRVDRSPARGYNRFDGGGRTARREYPQDNRGTRRN